MIKGFVDPLIGTKKKMYKAKHPQVLRQYVKKKRQSWEKREREIDDIFSDLVNAYKDDRKPVMRYRDGVEGIKLLYEEKLDSKTDIFSVLDVESWKTPEFWPWVEEYHKKRIKRGIHEHILLLDTPEGRAWFQEYDGIPEMTTYKWVSREKVKKLLQYGGAVDVSGDTVMISLLDQKKKMGIVIESPMLANIIQALFELAWETAEPVVFAPH